METTASFLYLQIAETIPRRIASGVLEPGDRLPPVRTMALDWDWYGFGPVPAGQS